jgi:thiamine-phosphate pyrophosphorylase
MAELKHRCRLYFQFPAQPSAKLEAQLAQAIGTTDAACVLLCGDGNDIDENHVSLLIDSVQASGLACLIENDAELAERLGADGLHVDADSAVYAAARKRLGESANIGAFCGLDRHAAMLLAEMGADYIAFGAEAESSIDAINQHTDLIAWWSEIFVVPSVAWNVADAEQAARLAALGADFVAPPLQIWREDDALRLIGEIDRAVRDVRRAA